VVATPSDWVVATPSDWVAAPPSEWVAEAAKRTLAASAQWSSLAPTAAEAAAGLRAPGWVSLPSGLPRHWAWAIFSFVEALHEAYAHTISQSLAAALEAEEEVAGRECKLARTSASSPGRRSSSAPSGNSSGAPGGAPGGGSRPGEHAAAEVTAQLHRRGIAISVYAGPPSQAQAPPYAESGPRFYVSVTRLALAAFPEGAPPMPPALRESLWPHAPAAAGLVRVRGLGWALAPPGSDPQLLHADIWGHRHKPMPRFPHVIWKRGFTANATTQLVPSGFTRGRVAEEHYSGLTQAGTPALIFDSEILHRGAETPPPPPPPSSPQGGIGGSGDIGGGGGHGAGWLSSCSVELCSFSGWEEWVRGTGGTEFSDAPEWRMLPIRASRGHS
jgi:hypothetical protein